MVMIVILSYSYSSSQSTLPLYRQQLQNPTKLIQLTLEAYFPKEASVLFSKRSIGTGTTSSTSNTKPVKRRTDE